MRVGVDCRSLTGDINGISRYLYNLLNYIGSVKKTDIDIYLFSPGEFSEAYGSLESSKAKIIFTPKIHNKLLRQFWFEFTLPYLANKYKIDVFWSPAHRIPILMPLITSTVVTIHDLVWVYYGTTMSWPTRVLDKFLMPYALKNADVVCSVSTSTMQDIITKYPFINKTKIISPSATCITNKRNISFSDRQYFLFVGTIEPRKNIANLLKAYASLTRCDKSKAMLIIAGGQGWGKVNLKDIITRLDLTEHVEVLGHVDDATLATLYVNAQFLVMPSLYEGFGLPLVEAMSYGIPVLTANNSSMPEVVGNAGLLVDALDVKSIADGLQEMITNNELRERLAKNAKLNASRFSWDESAKKLITVFEKAIDLRKDKLA